MFNIRWYEHGRDLEPIVNIDTKGNEDYWTTDEFNKQLKQKSVTCLVVEENETIIGFIVYELFLHRFTILRFGVLPQHRNKGVGTALLKAVEEKLSPKRPLISIEVRETNLSVQLFLKTRGYRAVEVLRNYYADNGEDAYVMHYRTDTPSAD